MLKSVCPHYCKDCFAIRVCAVKAMAVQEGAVHYETDKCIGCDSCKSACTSFGYKMLRTRRMNGK
jgi:Fe-S-cluster-containing dehydrogenase component